MENRIMAAARQELDKQLKPLQPVDRFAPPLGGWIKTIRSALGMSMAQLAQRVGVHQPQIAWFEKSETAGTIQLNSLERLAHAMDCQVVYALVPNRSLEKIVHDQAESKAKKTVATVDQTMLLENQRTTEAERKSLESDHAKALVDSRALWS